MAKTWLVTAVVRKIAALPREFSTVIAANISRQAHETFLLPHDDLFCGKGAPVEAYHKMRRKGGHSGRHFGPFFEGRRRTRCMCQRDVS